MAGAAFLGAGRFATVALATGFLALCVVLAATFFFVAAVFFAAGLLAGDFLAAGLEALAAGFFLAAGILEHSTGEVRQLIFRIVRSANRKNDTLQKLRLAQKVARNPHHSPSNAFGT